MSKEKKNGNERGRFTRLYSAIQKRSNNLPNKTIVLKFTVTEVVNETVSFRSLSLNYRRKIAEKKTNQENKISKCL